MDARAAVHVAAFLTAMVVSCPTALADAEEATGVRIWYPPVDPAAVATGPGAPVINNTQIVQQKVVIVLRRAKHRTGAFGPRYPFSTALGPLYPF